jgi:CBS domain containing-hemolysin-like protein
MNEISIIIATLFASAFFSGMEIAFVSSDKLRLELDKSKNRLNAKLINVFNRHPGQYISTMLVGNNIALVVYSLAFAKLTDSFLAGTSMDESIRIIVQTTISTIIILFIAEFFPKAVFRLNPNLALNLLSFPVAIFYVLFYPLTRFILFISRGILKFFFKVSIKPRQEQRVFGKIDLNNLVGEGQKRKGENQKEIDNEIKLFRKALDFSKVRIRDCMVPRPDMEVLEVTAEIDLLRQKFVETGYSKILIYKNGVDNIIGYVHSSDLFHNPRTIESCLRKVFFVPETMEANKLLSKLLREHKSTAIVVDEFGGTAGMITTEDILEEIFGEIEDEHDTQDNIEKVIGENHFVFSGRTTIESINDKYNLHLEINDNYETLAGYILYHYSSFPKSNTILYIEKYEFKILRSSKTKIDLIEMKMIGNV